MGVGSRSKGRVVLHLLRFPGSLRVSCLLNLYGALRFSAISMLVIWLETREHAQGPSVARCFGRSAANVWPACGAEWGPLQGALQCARDENASGENS